MGRKHTPMRTCVVCRETHPKRELIRVVRTPEGEVVIDLTGKRSGRGAYLCRRAACWEGTLKGNALEHALKTSLTEEDRTRLRTFIGQLEEDAEAAR